MISPLGTLIAYLRSYTDLTDVVDTRIAAQHDYDNAWDRSSPGVAITYATGQPDNYSLQFQGRMEMRCYGPTPAVADDVYRLTSDAIRAVQRGPVTLLDNSVALLQSITWDSGPSMVWDQDVDLPFVVVYLWLMVAETALT